MSGYSIFQSHGAWFCRWTEQRDGKRTWHSHRLCSVRDYRKKAEVNVLAAEYMRNVGKTQTVEAGSTVSEFVQSVFMHQKLADSTLVLYRQAWRRLEPFLGHLRLRDVRCADVQRALESIHTDRGESIGHQSYMHAKVSASAIFSMALRLGHHPGPNPEDGTSIRGFGHNDHRENGAYTLGEIWQFLKLFPAGPVAVAIGINAFLALRAPELKALLPDDYDAEHKRIRIHRDTKTGNDEWLPVVEPLAKLLADGWDQIRLRSAKAQILKKIAGTSLRWKGWYAFRRGLATTLYQLGMRPEEACLILRNSAEVVRKHYIRLAEEGTKVDAMARFEQAYAEIEEIESSSGVCAALVQQKLQ